MARKAKELSALTVARLKAPGRHAVGGVDGLYLRNIGNSRAWVLRIKIDQRRSDIGLGPYPEVSLADARDAARTERRKVREGVDPVQQRIAARSAQRAQKAGVRTFQDCATDYIEAHKAGWKSDKHAKQWTATLKAYAFPAFGLLSIADVDTAVVQEVLQPIWAIKPETASRLRGRIESVLDWAKVQSYRTGENPARWRGHLDHLFPARVKVKPVQHHPALPYDRLPVFLRDLRKRDGMAARALEFLVLTAARSGEVRGMVWGELDFDAKVWTIPANRMKAGKEHRVPLATAAVAILEALPHIEGTDFVFVAPRGGPLSDMTLSAVLRRMKLTNVTVHGFRSTFRDWAGETSTYPREVIEHALAHQLKDKAEAAYQRGDLLTKRATLMAEWGSFVHSKSDDLDTAS